ncbi:uncharacterized protein Z518_05686 [Rhinocladiella mackenziei CBS 650.93]|uniref:AB hydrolase-1 domain-containing protein n=1 Tax=Rhinocladiella mackenziei CBS 650.93 TaxID=1442369 RepID=A0A0D2J6W5_9EURO|nr:uncharacterized protein Z518_05686 [Rhinocladiella mackenziei CBS 650.93]KIX04815.1 hypothetical protein Z518_05686 [Rhinocladiella mackenziei CBS 650.93]
MSAQTAITQYITAKSGVRFAYRRIGTHPGVPLVMHIHYRANMDLRDPLFVNSLARARTVIIFDDAGVGRSSGEVPETFREWADDLIAFVETLGLKHIDLLGFSMGGYTVQMVALTAPHLVRKLILSASTPSADHIAGVVWPREKALAFSFFYDDDLGRAAFEKYWRTAESLILDLLDRECGVRRQFNAATDSFRRNPRASFDRLGKLKMPVLVANGDNDTLIPSSRSWELTTQIANAQLIIYLRVGHGFLWQYPQPYATHVNIFLDGTEFDNLLSKL